MGTAEAFESFCDQAPTCPPTSPPSTMPLLAIPAPASAGTLIFGQTPHSPVLSFFLYSFFSLEWPSSSTYPSSLGSHTPPPCSLLRCLHRIYYPGNMMSTPGCHRHRDSSLPLRRCWRLPFHICYSAKNPDPRCLTLRPSPPSKYILNDRMASLCDCWQDFGGASLLPVVTAALSEERNQENSGFPHNLSDHNPFMDIRTSP